MIVFEGIEGAYVVKRGDSLSKIAVAHGQSASAWRDLFELNRETMREAQSQRARATLSEADPNVVYAGMTLQVPDAWTAAPVAVGAAGGGGAKWVVVGLLAAAAAWWVYRRSRRRG